MPVVVGWPETGASVWRELTLESQRQLDLLAARGTVHEMGTPMRDRARKRKAAPEGSRFAKGLREIA